MGKLISRRNYGCMASTVLTRGLVYFPLCVFRAKKVLESDRWSMVFLSYQICPEAKPLLLIVIHFHENEVYFCMRIKYFIETGFVLQSKYITFLNTVDRSFFMFSKFFSICKRQNLFFKNNEASFSFKKRSIFSLQDEEFISLQKRFFFVLIKTKFTFCSKLSSSFDTYKIYLLITLLFSYFIFYGVFFESFSWKRYF